MKCKECSHELEGCEHFVVHHKDNGEKTFMCETCFFDLALNELNYESVQMDSNGINYYNPALEFEEDE